LVVFIACAATGCFVLMCDSTHGASRPFLPAMIRKNDASTVLEATSAAAEALSSLRHDSSSSQALEATLAAMAAASKLTGVGPATASLVLAVFKPDLVPFFQDELWAWCFPEKVGTKLKYDKKEYEALFRKMWDIKNKLGASTGMVQLEKASFVLQHMDLVSNDDQTTSLEAQSEAKATEIDPDTATMAQKMTAAGKSKTANTKRTLSAKHKSPELADGNDAPRRSKRARKIA
jgi:hypothetical protein